MWPKTLLDWLGIVALWGSAAIIALKIANVPCVWAVSCWLTSPWWGYVPFALLTLFIFTAVLRMSRD